MTKIQPLCQPQWTRRLLIVAMSAAVSSQALALEAISDEELSVTTGEGIAFLPENVSLRMNGADTNNSGAGTFDTGYIRIIPVGPLTPAAAASGAGKGDVFLYGLAISKGNRDFNNRLSATDPLIGSWGTAINPWLLAVKTQNSISNFSNTNCVGAADPLCQVSFLSLEAPLYNLTLPTTPATGSDAYNLKVAYWADIFVRNPAAAENMGAIGTQFDVGGGASQSRPNRLRLQAIMDGISLNGTRIQMFQTLGGAVTGATGGNAKDPFYNNTLGIAGVVRLNSGDTRATGGSVPYTVATTSTAGSVNRTVSVTNRYSAGDTSNIVGRTTADATGAPGAAPTAYQRFRLRSVDTVDTITSGSSTLTLPSTVSAVRFSTRETTNTSLLDTPAIGSGSGSAPTFDPDEGVFLYGLNANLILGSLAQPIIFGKDATSNNLVLELAAIPNKAEFYKQIYTAYAGYTGTLTPAQIAEYKGSTCNVYQCGTPIQVNGTSVYQGNTATHSSISIGSTNYSGTTASGGTNLLTAFSGEGAFGVSFGALKSQAATVTTNRYYELEFQRRDRLSDTQWRYATNAAATSFANGTNNCATTGGNNCNEFNLGIWIPVAAGGNFVLTSGPTAGAATDNIYLQYIPNTSHPAYFIPGRTAAANFANGATCTPAPCTPTSTSIANAAAWGPLSGAVVTMNAGLPKQWNENAAPVLPATPAAPQSFNNLGSAVIDGMLIQHLKFTTKGL